MFRMQPDGQQKGYPLLISRALDAAEKACIAGDGNDEAPGAECHEAALRLADALTYYVGAVAVAQYSQALYTGQISGDPTLNRSLRSLRRVLPGQWLGWAARGLAAASGASEQNGVRGLAEWYSTTGGGKAAEAYNTLRGFMVANLAYTGEYGPQQRVSPRLLLELTDQYRIRRGKTPAESIPVGTGAQIGKALLAGLRELVDGAAFLKEYELYAPGQRQMLVGLKPVTPMPPVTPPAEAASAATLLLYPPGELPDYTKRPDLQKERLPLFPLDPLLEYLRCEQCGRHRIAALREVVAGAPHYCGLDPDCGHEIQPDRTQ